MYVCMYVCMYVHMYVCIWYSLKATHTYACTYVPVLAGVGRLLPLTEDCCDNLFIAGGSDVTTTGVQLLVVPCDTVTSSTGAITLKQSTHKQK